MTRLEVLELLEEVLTAAHRTSSLSKVSRAVKKRLTEEREQLAGAGPAGLVFGSLAARLCVAELEVAACRREREKVQHLLRMVGDLEAGEATPFYVERVIKAAKALR